MNHLAVCDLQDSNSTSYICATSVCQLKRPLRWSLVHWMVHPAVCDMMRGPPSCSGITLRYDKPSLKVGELSRMCQPLAQGGDKSRQTTQSHWRVLQAYVLCSRTKRGYTERSRSGSKRTSWIVRATILGFIYTLEVLLSKLSWSVSSK